MKKGKSPINKLTTKEQLFVSNYLATNNLTKSVLEAGYVCDDPCKYGCELLQKESVRQEIMARKKLIESEASLTASATEILQFYTSVMRGQVLDQFGIEASLDTRIKAANELAKHQIELPMKLEQKNITNNIGSITLNFIPRQTEIIDTSS